MLQEITSPLTGGGGERLTRTKGEGERGRERVYVGGLILSLCVKIISYT